MKTGFIVEKKIKGCGCEPLSVMDWDYKGKDYWSDLTGSMDKDRVSSSDDIDGMCPNCGADVVYREYLVVTEKT